MRTVDPKTLLCADQALYPLGHEALMIEVILKP